MSDKSDNTLPSTDRVNPFKSLETEDLDDFVVATKPKKAIPSKTEIDNLSELTGFPSREPQNSKKIVRRYTTGRNIQLNIKITSQAQERFYSVADQLGVPLGEAFEQAVKLLELSLKKR